MRSSTLVLALSLVLASALGPVAWAATNSAPASDDQPVRGTVKAIRGEFVVVDMTDSQWLPRGGASTGLAKLHVAFEVPGVGLVKSDEDWYATQVDRYSFEMRASSNAALASVRPGYAVVIPRSDGIMPMVQTRADYDKGHAEVERYANAHGTGAMAALYLSTATSEAWRIGDFDSTLDLAAKIDEKDLTASLASSVELQVAKVLEVRGHLRDAETHYRKAVALDPKVSSPMACLFFVRHNALDRGRTICDTCLQVDRPYCASLPGVVAP